AATGVRVEEAGDGDQNRDLTVAVTDGDVLVVFEMIDGDQADETDFLAFVDAGMLKLAEAGGGQFSAA
ncbi:hypothetical protein, partial [Actinoplanes philippinensis]|uniref:hypothetical protein n=1 Tax=Actinoplanes philippinensis TaxID=35752 RepID=UPI0033CB483C